MDKEPSIMVREPDATMQPAPQDNQLMSKYRVLSFKPHLQLEWRGQDGQNETEQPNHSASLGDSFTASTRTRFSIHTVLCHMCDTNGTMAKPLRTFASTAWTLRIPLLPSTKRIVWKK